MTFDLIIRGADVIDGLGTPRYRADVGVTGSRISRIGPIHERGTKEIEADGCLVTPGFIDAHTHMDAQIFWDPLGTCSCWHGVTTAVMGNCGFSLAPADQTDRPLVVSNLERAEDISGVAMGVGIKDWSWGTFRTYLDAIERLPKGINYGAYIGHSALRIWTMGERAFDGAASDEDLLSMENELVDALDAGAVGFSTSQSPAHLMADGRPVASRQADWHEVVHLVGVLGEHGPGVCELAPDPAYRSEDVDVRHEYYERLRGLASDTGVPLTFGIFDRGNDLWRDELRLLEPNKRYPGRIIGQSHSRDIPILLSFETSLPFDQLPEWRSIRSLPLEAQAAQLSDPRVRTLLIEAALHGSYASAVGAEPKPPDYKKIRILDRVVGRSPTIEELATSSGRTPIEVMIDAALSADLKVFFTQTIHNEDRSHVEEILRSPRTVMTFSDSGAHVSQIMDSSIHTHLLAEWVREREAFSFEEAVNMITLRPALLWGLRDRGCVREGMFADLNVIDPDEIGPELPKLAHDLPGGVRRLVQKSRGILATVVNGSVLFDAGVHTGVFPGRLLRRRAGHPG